MLIRIIEETAESLVAYASVPIAFRVTSRLLVPDDGKDCSVERLAEEAVSPYTKDYDALPGEGPLSWPARWDLANWGLLAAFQDRRRIGGAAVAWSTPGVDLLHGRDDLAVLWDLRVHPEYRGQGVGKRLFEAAIAWAQRHGCRELRVETQNVNVAACRFYARQGCTLGEAHPLAYPDLPEEIQLIWYRELSETQRAPIRWPGARIDGETRADRW
jgi:GNAT superfamily N-acetyltransferase